MGNNSSNQDQSYITNKEQTEELTKDQKRARRSWIWIILGILLFFVLTVLILIKNVANDANSIWYLVFIGVIAACSLATGLILYGSKKDDDTLRETVVKWGLRALILLTAAAAIATSIPSFGYATAVPITLFAVFLIFYFFYVTWMAVYDQLKVDAGVRATRRANS